MTKYQNLPPRFSIVRTTGHGEKSLYPPLPVHTNLALVSEPANLAPVLKASPKRRKTDNKGTGYLELLLAHGSRREKVRALEELSKRHCGKLVRRGSQIAAQWGLLEPIMNAQDAVTASAQKAFEKIASFSLAPGSRTPSYTWMSKLMIDELREIQHQQIFITLDSTGLQTILRTLAVPDDGREAEEARLNRLLEALETPAQRRLVENYLMRESSTGCWSDLLQAFSWGTRDDPKVSATR